MPGKMVRRGAVTALVAVLAGCAGLSEGFRQTEFSELARPGNDRFDNGERHATLPADCSIPSEYEHPPLMVIGDSLSNGVQSLYLDRFLSEWSFPNLIAIRAGLIEERDGDRTGERRFYSPDYPGDPRRPRNLPAVGLALPDASLFDMLRAKPQMNRTYEALVRRQRDNNGRVFVENLGAFGMSTVEAVNWTGADYRRVAEVLHEDRRHRNPVEAVFYRNAYFVANPTGQLCLDGWTLVDQVIRRKPASLLVALGSNNGLYNMAFRSRKADDAACEAETVLAFRAAGIADDEQICEIGPDGEVATTVADLVKTRYVADMTRLLERVDEEGETANVYVLGLIEPTRTANVTLEGDVYVNEFLRGAGLPPARWTLEKSEMERNANAIRTANAAIRSRIDAINARNHEKGATKRIHFLDIDGFFADHYDYKGCLADGRTDCADKQVRIVYGDNRSCNRRFDNRPFKLAGSTGGRGAPPYCRNDAALSDAHYTGGLFSLDNMHLSSVGYAILARFVTDEMRKVGDPIFDGIDAVVAACGTPEGRVTKGACAAYVTAPETAVIDRNRRDGEPLRRLSEGHYERAAFNRWLMARFQ